MWDGERLVPCRKTGSKKKPGVGYVLLDAAKGYSAGQLFIGYESKNHLNNKTYVQVVRWVGV